MKNLAANYFGITKLGLPKFIFMQICLSTLFMIATSGAHANPFLCKDIEFSSKESIISSAVQRASKAALDLEEINQFYPNIAETYKEVLAMVDPKAKQPLLSIVVPAYKEAQRLPESLVKIQQFFNLFPIPVEVNIIVEKSPDYTWDIGSQVVSGDSRIHVIDNQIKQGKGYAVRSGMQRATGQYVLFMDADLSTPLPEILNFLKYL